MHLHLDPLGGIAGDMFAAALLDAFPDAAYVACAHAEAASGVACSVQAARDGALTGRRFSVATDVDGDNDAAIGAHAHAFSGGHEHGLAHGHGHADTHDLPHAGGGHAGGGEHAHGSTHGHAHWRNIRAMLGDGRLPLGVATRAQAIFGLLADAEARVHGVAPDDVAFHEVGARDSIADIAAAASLIETLGISSASVSPIPIGGGRVRTAHGIMPVPAPATAILLEGMATLDDGIPGERVTPTGAAILRHLAPGPRPATPQVLRASGAGFGTRSLPGIANCLRATLFSDAADTEAGASGNGATAIVPHRRLAMIAFEIDDQSGEDLAAGVARLRALDFVHDVVQIPAIGKKGRFAVQLQVLAAEDRADDAIDACFRETTTIGLRLSLVEGRALSRRIAAAELGAGDDVRVKLVERPGGTTGKAEADDVADAGDAAARANRRARAVAAVLGR